MYYHSVLFSCLWFFKTFMFKILDDYFNYLYKISMVLHLQSIFKTITVTNLKNKNHVSKNYLSRSIPNFMTEIFQNYPLDKIKLLLAELEKHS